MKICRRMISAVLVLCLLCAPVLAETRPVYPEYYEDFNYPDIWQDERGEISNSAYTFAFVGDTQMVTYFDEDNLHKIYDWLVEIADKENLKHVFGLGDITQMNLPSEWKKAVGEIQKLDGVVPYTLVRGNHDGLTEFKKYCKYDSYVEQLDGMFNGTILNTYKLFSVGTIDYLFLNLDYGPSDKVLEWACGVVEQYPDRNVIITTHAYLAKNGEHIDATNTSESIVPTNDGGFNNGPDIWDKLVRKYANIVMVVCGHVGSRPELLETELKGDHGNTVRQVLVDPQRLDLQALGKPETLDVASGSVGMVALFHFSADGKTVQVENYSTVQQRYYGPGLTFTLNCLGGNIMEEPAVFVPADSEPGEDAAPGETDDNRSRGNIPAVIACLGAVVICSAIPILLRRKRK